MELFDTLNKTLTANSTVTITVIKVSDDKMNVLTAVSASGTSNNIPPFKVSGSPAELDRDYAAAIKEPVKVINDTMVDIKAIEAQAKAAKEAAEKAAKDKTSSAAKTLASSKANEERTKDNDAYKKMKNDAESLFAKGDYKGAKAKFEEAMKFAEEKKQHVYVDAKTKKEMEKKIAECKKKIEAPSMFGFDAFDDFDEEKPSDEAKDEPTDEPADEEPAEAEEPEEPSDEDSADNEDMEDEEEQEDAA